MGAPALPPLTLPGDTLWSALHERLSALITPLLLLQRRPQGSAAALYTAVAGTPPFEPLPEQRLGDLAAFFDAVAFSDAEFFDGILIVSYSTQRMWG